MQSIQNSSRKTFGCCSGFSFSKCEHSFYPFVGLLKDFKALAQTDEEILTQIKALRNDVHEFASKYPMPGSDDI